MYQQGIMLSQVKQSIGMVGLKMENTYLQALTSIRYKQVTTQKHARW